MPPTNDDPQQLMQAGIAAEEATDWSAAVEAYERCLTALAAGGAFDEAEVLTRLGRCYWNLSEARTAWRTLRRAISLYEQRGDGVGQARATVEILRIWGPPVRQREMADAALAALAGADPYLRARLLVSKRWDEAEGEAAFDEAIAIAERHGYGDLLALRTEREAWRAQEEGRLDESLALREQVFEAYAQARRHDWAAATLRGAGFFTIATGALDDGVALAERCFVYACGAHLAFSAQLALMDMAGVLYARGEFDRCEETLARSPGTSDFRADLYRMWMAEARDGAEAALPLMVDPARGGNTPTAMGQIHAAAAGVLYRAGKLDAARSAMQAWRDVPRAAGDDEDYVWEAPALLGCLLNEGDDELIRKVRDAIQKFDARGNVRLQFTTLQGRALAPLRGGIAMRLGLIEEARRAYADGLAWCQRERLVRDAELCRAGFEGGR